MDALFKTTVITEKQISPEKSYLVNNIMTEGRVPGPGENNNWGLEITTIFILV